MFGPLWSLQTAGRPWQPQSNAPRSGAIKGVGVLAEGARGNMRLQRKQASIYRKVVPCGRYDLAGPGLYSQRELTFVLFFARVLLQSRRFGAFSALAHDVSPAVGSTAKITH